jgi:hypothetical protein
VSSFFSRAAIINKQLIQDERFWVQANFLQKKLVGLEWAVQDEQPGTTEYSLFKPQN